MTPEVLAVALGDPKWKIEVECKECGAFVLFAEGPGEAKLPRHCACLQPIPRPGLLKSYEGVYGLIENKMQSRPAKRKEQMPHPYTVFEEDEAADFKEFHLASDLLFATKLRMQKMVETLIPLTARLCIDCCAVRKPLFRALTESDKKVYGKLAVQIFRSLQ